MTKYTVTGGTPLRGTVQLHGAKNAGFKAMIAALLADTPSTICDLGLISEIDFAKQAITQLGGKITQEKDSHCITVDPRNLKSFDVPREIGEKSRASNFYAVPLLAKFGRAVLPIPGGDKIGRRPLERHFAGLELMGAKVTMFDDRIEIEEEQNLKGVTFRFPKNTHTGTEFLILAAVKAEGETILENAAAEPEVDDLIKFLNLMGGKIKRIAPRTVKVSGVRSLEGAKHTVMKDRNEAATFGCSALATGGNIKVEGADADVLRIFLDKLKEAKAEYRVDNNAIQFSYKDRLKATDIIAAPYPQFMTDWQPLWATLMTQATGVSTVHETIYERRFDYVQGLINMGARIEFFEPEIANPDEVYNFNIGDDTPGNKHAIKIFGPTQLHGTEIEVNDVRSGATALMAGVIASGQTAIVDPRDQIKRGYEELPEQLVGLGAKIQIVYN